MDTSGMYPMPDVKQTPSKNPQVIIAILIIGVLIIGSVGAYFMTKNRDTEKLGLENDLINFQSTVPSSVEIFKSVETNTTRYEENELSTLTYLQAHDDEIAYCSKFDEKTDGTTVAQLLDPVIIKAISDRVGESITIPLSEKLKIIMGIDNGLLTDLCNYNGDVWGLILSSDLQTMIPYHFTESEGEYFLNAYNPFLTQGGYGSLFFDHIPNRIVAATGYSEDGLLEWEYYILDGESGATDLIESCNQKVEETLTTLECAREYIP
ncbi:MAG: hypothetical protein WCT28_01350 [Patescibacteria group bacterium]|jgi:hypothetical protein